MRSFIRQLRPALLSIVVFTVVFGFVYPMLSTLIGQVAFGDKAGAMLDEAVLQLNTRAAKAGIPL